MSGVQNQLVDFMEKVKPLAAQALVLLDKAFPYVEYGIKRAIYIYSISPQEIISAVFGLCLCFFGGTFVITIAAYEAWKSCGWETTKANLVELYHEYEEFRKVSEKDDQKDDDGDGIPDVQQIDAKTLVSRKAHLFIVSCKEPQKLSAAIAGLWTSWLAVMATLRIQFAQVIALGVSIGNILRVPAKGFLGPVIKGLLPVEDYKKWVDVVLDFTCKLIAITIAWFVQRVIAAVQSGIRGGLMFSRSLLKFALKKGYISFDDEDTYIDEVVGWSVAAFGIYFQISYGFAVPFPLNIVMLPVQLLEWFLMWTVSD